MAGYFNELMTMSDEELATEKERLESDIQQKFDLSESERGEYRRKIYLIGIEQHNRSTTTLDEIKWLQLGSTSQYDALKKDIALVCRDVTQAACIDEICIHDILYMFKKHGYVVKREK